jgi:two-component system OmpR family response regulator
MCALKLHKLRVLVVEDAPDILEGLSELLTATGRCEIVGCAASEQQALDWSFQHEAGFDVAIVDLLLQDGSGFAVLSHLVKYQPGKVVVLSEFVTPVLAQRCLALGVVAAFTKSQSGECIEYVLTMARRAGN